MKKIITLFALVAVMTTSAVFAQTVKMDVKAIDFGHPTIVKNVDAVSGVTRATAEESDFWMYAETDDDGYFKYTTITPDRWWGSIYHAAELAKYDNLKIHGMRMYSGYDLTYDNNLNDLYNFYLLESTKEALTIVAGVQVMEVSEDNTVDGFFEEPIEINPVADYFILVEPFGESILFIAGKDLPETNELGNLSFVNGDGFYVHSFRDQDTGLTVYYPWAIGMFVTYDAKDIPTILKREKSFIDCTVTSGEINVTANGTVKVMDLSGRVLETKTVNGSESMFLNYAKGIYMISVTENGNTTTQKVVLK